MPPAFNLEGGRGQVLAAKTVLISWVRGGLPFFTGLANFKLRHLTKARHNDVEDDVRSHGVKVSEWSSEINIAKGTTDPGVDYFDQ